MRLYSLIFILVLLTACSSVNEQIPAEPTNDSEPIEPILQNNSEKCPEGYILAPEPGLTPPDVPLHYYCKINKEWTEFKPCTSSADCLDEETCGSPGFMRNNTEAYDFRCAPSSGYKSDCWFTPPDGTGWCM